MKNGRIRIFAATLAAMMVMSSCSAIDSLREKIEGDNSEEETEEIEESESETTDETEVTTVTDETEVSDETLPSETEEKSHAFDTSIIIDKAKKSDYQVGVYAEDFAYVYYAPEETGMYFENLTKEDYDKLKDEFGPSKHAPYKMMVGLGDNIEKFAVVAHNDNDMCSVFVINFDSEASALAYYDEIDSFMRGLTKLKNAEKNTFGNKGEEKGVTYEFLVDTNKIGDYKDFYFIYLSGDSVILSIGTSQDLDKNQNLVGDMLKGYGVVTPNVEIPAEEDVPVENTDEVELPEYIAKYEFPDIPGMEIEEDLKTSYESYVYDYIAENVGLSASFQETIKIEKNGMPEEDSLPNIAGVTKYIIKDLDSDGTDDMLVFGFVQVEAPELDYASFKYLPFVLLCQADYDSIRVMDSIVYEPSDPAGYGYHSIAIESTLTCSFKFLSYITEDNTILLSFHKSGFVGDIGYCNALELTVENGKIKPITMLYQYNGGSADFKYCKFDLQTGEGTNITGEMYPQSVVALQWQDLPEHEFYIYIDETKDLKGAEYNFYYNFID